MITMEDWVTIRNMKKRNPSMGTRAIAKELGISRNTVKNALKSQEPPQYKREPRVNPELKPFKEYIRIQYTVKHLKGSRILRDLRAKGCEVTESAFYRYLSQLTKTNHQPYMRYETAPGEQAQFDWSPYTVMIAGKLTKVYIFCLILGFSRYRVYTASLSQSQSSVFEALEDGFHRIGGVTQRVQTDNHKTLVDKVAPELKWNRRYLKLTEYYAFTPSRSAVRHPWSKGKVENPFSYLENHFILDNEFSSFEELCTRLTEFEEHVNNRVHTTTHIEPIILFYDQEKDALHPLPERRFIGVKEEFRKVRSDCLVSYKTNFYSVPHIFACREVWVRVSQGRYLKIYSQSNKELATHVLVTDTKGKFVMDPAHFQGYRGTKGTWSSLCHQFLRHCPGEERFLDRLKAQKRINPSRHLTRIVEGMKHFTEEDIKRVVRLCEKYNLYNGPFFVELLHQEATPIESPLSSPSSPDEDDDSLKSPPGVVRSLDSYCMSEFTRP